MNRDEIKRIGIEAGISSHAFGLASEEAWQQVERFANLVASAEREACAVVAEKLGVHPALNVYNGGPDWYKHGKAVAKAIRERGEK